MIGCILLSFAAFATYASAQNSTEAILPAANKTDCVAQMVDWCKGMKYPQQGAGMAMLSIMYEDPNGYYRVFCSSDSDGTNCTRNSQPWFACVRSDDNNNTLTYKGQALSSNVDDDICMTADKAFHELFVQNLSYDNETLQTEMEKGMETFFAQIAAMQEQIEMIQRRLSGLPMFGGDDFWDGFLDGNPFVRPDNGTATRRANGTTIASPNEIEKE